MITIRSIRCLTSFSILLSAYFGGAETPVGAAKLRQSGFVDAEVGLWPTKKASEFMSAVVTLGTQHRVRNCSGVIVSDQGHILTATHCLHQCLFSEAPNSKGERICIFAVNGTQAKVKILAANTLLDPEKCSYYDVLLFHNIAESRRAKAKPECVGSKPTDLAIILPDRPIENSKCLSISTKQPELNTLSFALGFPERTERGSEFNPLNDSDGKKMTFSGPGPVVNRQVCFIDKKVNKKGELMDDFRLKHGDNFFQSAVDLVEGSSGGPLIDFKSHKVIGIAHGRTREHGLDQSCEGATLFQRVDRLHARLREVSPGYQPIQLKCSRDNVANIPGIHKRQKQGGRK